MSFHFSKKQIQIGVIVAIALFPTLFFVWNYLSSHPSTEDAYVQANTINLASQVTGPVENVFVKDHQFVQKGQLLFTIDPKPYQIAIDKAAATVAAQQAKLFLATQNAERILKLVKSGQDSKAAGDTIQSQLDDAKAELLAYQSQLAQAKLDLEHTQIKAPSSGTITQFVLRPGDNVIAHNTLFVLVEQENFWVDANFKETQVANIKPGQTAKITLDMYPGKTFLGVVDAVSSASGAVFSLLPPENASGNWVKVTQRFPVKVILKDAGPHFPFRAGATATVTINTTTA